MRDVLPPSYHSLSLFLLVSPLPALARSHPQTEAVAPSGSRLLAAPGRRADGAAGVGSLHAPTALEFGTLLALAGAFARLTLAGDATHDADGTDARVPPRPVQAVLLVEVAAAAGQIGGRWRRRLGLRVPIGIAGLAAVGRMSARRVLRGTRQRRARIARAVDAFRVGGAPTNRAFHVAEQERGKV